MYKWKVCPIQGRQLKDVRKEDIFGDFRICDTYRGGGGYDQFPYIAENRIDLRNFNGFLWRQFVVQLRGCHLSCFYCYVTSDGIRGKFKEYDAADLVNEFMKAYHQHDCGVFHLMGGSPALYIEHWHRIINLLPSKFIFHSDFLLTEGPYPNLQKMVKPNVLCAVNIKGVTSEDHLRNTGKEIDWKLFWYNFDKLVDIGPEFYLTFTNPDRNYLEEFEHKLMARYGESILNDSFIIDLIKYDALKVKTNDNNTTK